MMNFNLKEAKIYTAILWENFPLFKFAKKIKSLFLFLSFILFLIFIFGFVQNFSFENLKNIFGFFIIFLDLFFVFLIIDKFFNLKVKKPEPKILLKEALNYPERYNLAEFLSFETLKAIKESLDKVNGEIKKSHLLYFLLVNNPVLNFIFSRMLINIDEIKEKLKNEIEKTKIIKENGFLGEEFKNLLIESFKIALEKNHSIVELGDFFIAVIENEPVLKEIFILSGIKEEDFKNLVWILEKIKEDENERKKFWKYENLMKKGTLAKNWIAAYTLKLDEYSIDITEKVKNEPVEFISHKKEREVMERVLARLNVNNVLIVGESGAGRRSIVYGFAQESLSGKSLKEINYKRVVQLDMPRLLAEIQDKEQLEATLTEILDEAVFAGNIILVIDDFHNYIGQTEKPGVIDISGIILPYLQLPHFQIIAITNYEGLHKNIEKNSSILNFFEKIELKEISEEETLLILETLIPFLENKYKIFISYPALREIISLSSKYLPSLPFPEKAIDLLESVCVYVNTLKEERMVLPKHVAQIITEKTEIPVGEIQKNEKEILLNLENLIHQRVVNQEEAVKDISNALRRSRSQITIKKGPMGAFLFLGPTGVGKTETAKALAEFYFGSEERMIRVDMSEFQQRQDIYRLIGSEEEPGILAKQVRETPFSLVLLDELEKAHSDILNLFLQVFDEGYFTDAWGRKIDFKNTIIIATSNAGYEIILEVLKEITQTGPFLIEGPVGESDEVWNVVKKRVLDFIFEKAIFKPELINRFDSVVIFRPLTKKNLLDIVGLNLKKLKENLSEKGIEFIITDELKEKIIDLGYNPVFGAREIKRVIQDNVENVLAEALLKNEIKRGDIVKINPEDFKLIINP